MRSRSVNFQTIGKAALSHSETIAARWLSDGKRMGAEWICRNPTRADHKTGSFKVNLNTGRWGDFATGDKGGDFIALAAFLFRLDQRQAALKIADMLGINPYV